MIFSKVDGSASFAIIIPLINGIVVAYLSHLITDDIGNRLFFAVLASSATLHCRHENCSQKQILEFSCLSSYYFPFNITFECLSTFQ
jgi:hypothetical protein